MAEPKVAAAPRDAARTAVRSSLCRMKTSADEGGQPVGPFTVPKIPRDRRDARRSKKYLAIGGSPSWNIHGNGALCRLPALGSSIMRIVVAAFVLCAAAPVVLAVPAMAQTKAPDITPNFLKKEPYFLSPSSVVFVDTGTCGVGKVMKITGALGPLRRKKVCVPMGREEASRAFAIP